MENNIVLIGSKDIKHYFPAAFFALGKSKTIRILARGKNMKTALDLLAILKREYLEDPKYSIEIDSESFTYEEDGEQKERNVTTLEIELSGVRKQNKK